MHSSGTVSIPNPSHIMELASAFYGSATLFTASDLGVFGKLDEFGRADAATLARTLETSLRGTELLLNACVAVGLLTKDGNSYINTPEVSAYLVPGRPGDLSKAIRYNRDVYPAWGKLASLVKTGEPVEKPELHLGTDPERTRTFVLSMYGRAMGIGQSVVPELDLKGRKTLLDIGGGPGAYSTLIARANPEITCTVLDLPDVVAVSAELVSRAGMSERVKMLPGDYHVTPLPEGNDAVIIFGVLHQESPESIQDIFHRAYRAMDSGGLIYVLDMMTDSSHTSPAFSALFGLNMALTTKNGWVFSDKELEGWIREAGFVDFAVRPLPPPMPHWLAVAAK
jgi:3-hydroxy-5-methyl-1-naphthoate 3-O-methyltransferase